LLYINPIVPKGKQIFIDPKNYNAGGTPTIYEDEDESVISSMVANPKANSTKSVEMIISTVRPRSQSTFIASSKNVGTPKTDEVDGQNRLNKQNTPTMPLMKKLTNGNGLEAIDVSIPDMTPKNELGNKIADNEKPLETSAQDRSKSSIVYENNYDEVPEDLREEIPQEDLKEFNQELPEELPNFSNEEDKKEETPRVTSPQEQPLQYFESKDPPPRAVAPVGGSGPTLTKTLMKPNLSKINENEPKDEKNPEQIPEKTDVEIEEEELIKLEEEVARLQAEADAPQTDGNNVGESTEYVDQTYMVDGKRKRKKKKKKRRKVAGGGEETIGDITIDDVYIDEETGKEIPLNPPVKKKIKKKKVHKTELGTVEEDSKELSTIMDIKRLESLNEERFSYGKQSDIQDSPDYKSDRISSVSSVKKIDADLEIRPSNIDTNVPKKKESDVSEYKSENWVTNGQDEEQGFQPRELGVVVKEDSKHELTKELPHSKELAPVIQPSNQSPKIIDLPKEEPFKEDTKLKYLDEVEENEPSVLSSTYVFPLKTETHDKSTEDQSIMGPKFSSKILSENPSGLKKIKTTSEKLENKKMHAITMNGKPRLENFPGAISLLPLNCEVHREEYIKYFCREDDCKFGLCPECLSQHIGHDYIYADEIASFEIKQSLKATITE
jgi:hypothetical protein